MTIDPKTTAVVLIEYQNFWAFPSKSRDGCATVGWPGAGIRSNRCKNNARSEWVKARDQRAHENWRLAFA